MMVCAPNPKWETTVAEGCPLVTLLPRTPRHTSRSNEATIGTCAVEQAVVSLSAHQLDGVEVEGEVHSWQI